MVKYEIMRINLSALYSFEPGRSMVLTAPNYLNCQSRTAFSAHASHCIEGMLGVSYL